MNEFIELAAVLVVSYLVLRWLLVSFLPGVLHNHLSELSRREEEDRIQRKKRAGKLPKEY